MFKALLILIFIRPFISSLAFPCLNSIYSLVLLMAIALWTVRHGLDFSKIQSVKFPLLLFCLALTISCVFSQNKFNTLNELLSYISYLGIFVIVSSLEEGKKAALIRTVTLTAFIISLLAIYQYFLGFAHLTRYAQKNNITDPFTLDYISRRRAFFPFVTPNILAGYLIMVMPLTAVNKEKRWLILPLAFALLLTQSVGAIISLLLALAAYFTLQGKLKKRDVALISALLIVICLVVICRHASSKAHAQPLFSAIMRLNYWKETLGVIKAYPFSGVGIGNFSISLSRYAHNSYLQIWAEMGIGAVLSLLWLLAVVLFSSLKKLRGAKPDGQRYLSCLIMAAITFLMCNAVDFGFFLPEVSLLWWIILAAVTGSAFLS